MTSLPVTRLPVTSLPIAPPPQMWLELYPYTTGVHFSLLSSSSLSLLFSPSSRPSSPFSHPASPFSHPASHFPGSFLPVSLYPYHSLNETPLNRHRNVYVKLTPQNHPNFLVPSLDGLQKFQFIYYILKMCILFGIGIRTNFQNSKLLNLANFCEKP